jgi:hypothetical protein
VLSLSTISGSGGATLIGWNWLNQTGISGWSVRAIAGQNSSGEPDLIWQEAASPFAVTVYYYTMGCNYTYDDLARLSQVDCGSGNWGQSFTVEPSPPPVPMPKNPAAKPLRPRKRLPSDAWRSGTPCLVLGACLLAGCAAGKPPAPLAAIQPIGPSYIDLQPGWRLRVVTPILKSGGYRLRPTGQTADGNNISLSVGDDFVGYEVAYYAVKARNGVAFVSAEITRDGRTVPQPRPVAQLFQLPRGARHVRLIYLVRASQADHDMAVAAAKDMQALEALTRRVQADPVDACHDGQGAFCAWISSGIAVVPQLQRTIDGAREWAPAR